MRETVLDFYDSLAPHYHLLFEDWNESIERRARVLAPLLASRFPRPTTGFTEIRWLMPAESGFYQPIVPAQKPQTP
jgi:hypothetical protein